MKFLVDNGVWVILNCGGDELGLCETCKIKFLCYSGEVELPRTRVNCNQCPNKRTYRCNFIMQMIECYVFGSPNGLITHNDKTPKPKEVKTEKDELKEMIHEIKNKLSEM